MSNALVVLSDPKEAERFAIVVREAGWSPRWEPRTSVALELACREVPGLIVLETPTSLPGTGDVWRTLRLNPRLARTALIGVEVPERASPRRLGLKVGPGAILSRPLAPQSIRRALGEARTWRHGLIDRGAVGEITLEFNSTVPLLAEASELFLRSFDLTPLNPDQIRPLRQVFLELGQNAIEWGNRMQPEKRVYITFIAYGDRVQVVVRDEGEGFDPTQLPHAASNTDPVAHLEIRAQLGLRDGGFGLLISQGLVDEITHNQVGNEVTMVKRYPEISSLRGARGEAAGT
jgi:anti-sigma regulatory factor (Ser/Thr protein kinase)